VARPPIERAVGGEPSVTLFKPAGVPGRALEQLPLAVDELEAIRLVDLERLSHEQAAAVMGVSRQTVGRVLERGRAKVAEALVAGKALIIGGGQYRVEPRELCCAACGTVWMAGQGAEAAPVVCPSCGSTDVGTCWDPDGPCRASRGGRGRGCGGDRRGRGHGHTGGGESAGRQGRGRGFGSP